MKTLSTLLFILLLLVQQLAMADSFSGKVVKVLDGDTVEVLREGKAVRIRLAQIDAPEKNQPFGQAAKRYVLEAAAHQHVKVQVDTIDKYGRTVGEIFLPDGGNLNRMLVVAGYAWHYKHYSKDATYGDLEKQARNKRLGLWQDKNPTPPWDWRKGIRQNTQANIATSAPRCGDKRYCKQMTSCAEAKYYLIECGLTRLDRDGDGIPCESLCR